MGLGWGGGLVAARFDEQHRLQLIAIARMLHKQYSLLLIDIPYVLILCTVSCLWFGNLRVFAMQLALC